MKKKKFAAFDDPSKRTSGQRFWTNLQPFFSAHPDFEPKNPDVLFFNISAPFSLIFKNWMKGKKIVIRLDGIYHEKVGLASIKAMESKISSAFIWLIFKIFGPTENVSFLMNLLRHNKKLLFKVSFANALVYQSQFSRSLWHRYFSKKPSVVSLNGRNFLGRTNQPKIGHSQPIRLLTTYDSWRPSKRLHDLIQFLKWHNQNLPNLPVELLIIGYTKGSNPQNLTNDDLNFIETSRSISLEPPFKDYTPALEEKMRSSHIYISFSFRDNCPNAVIEAMSYGLPVIATNSGGIPEIIKDAGEIVSLKKDPPYFCSFDHSFDFPEITFSEVSMAIEKIASNYNEYCKKVERRFKDQLGLEQVAKNYLEILKLEF